MRNLTLKQLRIAAAVARCGKIVDAAGALGLTPPAVTIQIKQMEDDLGLALFDRTRDGFRPTGAGEALIAAAAQIADVLRSLDQSLRTLQGLGSGSVSVGVVSTAKYFAPAMIASFRRSHPDIDVRLKVGNREDIVADLQGYEIDLAIMGRPPRDIAVRAHVFGDHPLVIVACADHRLAGRRDIPRAELAGETFLLRERGSGTRGATEIYLGDVLGGERAAVEFGSNETIKQAVIAGLGIAFLSAHTVAAEVAANRLALLDVEDLPLRRQWFIVCRRAKALLPAGQAFYDFVLTRGVEHLPTIPLLYRAGNAA